MNVGDKIWDIKISKFRNAKADEFVWGMRDGIDIREYEVLGMNHLNLVLNDLHFSTYMLRDVDLIKVDIRVDGHFMGDGVFVSIISTSPPDADLTDRMVSAVNTKVSKEYGWLTDFVADLNNLLKEY